MFTRLPSLFAGLFASSLLLLVPACGGGGIGPDTREPYRAVLVVGDAVGNRNNVLTLPGVERPESAAVPAYNGVPESTLCDDANDTTNGRDIDGRCYTIVGGDDTCLVTTGYSRYDTRLGSFSVRLVNNQGVDEILLLEGFGFNLRIHDAAGNEVWNMLEDHDDLRDAVAEVGYREMAKAGCAVTGVAEGSISANGATVTTEPFSFYTPTTYFVDETAPYRLDAGKIYSMTVSWDGRDSNGNAVSPGTYTVYTDILVRNAVTGLAWSNPEPATLTIEAAPTPAN